MFRSGGMSIGKSMNVVHIGRLHIGKGRPCIIVPLTSSSEEELMAEASALSSVPADMVEWRVDMFGASGDLDDEAILKTLERLRGKLSLPLLATFRTSDEGGARSISEERYASLCGLLCESGLIDLLDVEAFFRSGRAGDIIARAHACGVPVVASNHDFHATPPREEIVRRLLFMQNELDADILKIAVMPQSREDVITLLAATQEASAIADRPVITMSMGPLGVISRVCGQSFGSAATFGAARSASAPGQMDVTALDAVLRALDDAMRS